eukprot:755840-Pyramimonas_sp.AAC.1
MGPVSMGESRVSAAERGGIGRIWGRAAPPIHGCGDRAPNPWIASPCLRAPDSETFPEPPRSHM